MQNASNEKSDAFVVSLPVEVVALELDGVGDAAVAEQRAEVSDVVVCNGSVVHLDRIDRLDGLSLLC